MSRPLGLEARKVLREIAEHPDRVAWIDPLTRDNLVRANLAFVAGKRHRAVMLTWRGRKEAMRLLADGER